MIMPAPMDEENILRGKEQDSGACPQCWGPAVPMAFHTQKPLGGRVSFYHCPIMWYQAGAADPLFFSFPICWTMTSHFWSSLAQALFSPKLDSRNYKLLLHWSQGSPCFGRWTPNREKLEPWVIEITSNWETDQRLKLCHLERCSILANFGNFRNRPQLSSGEGGEIKKKQRKEDLTIKIQAKCSRQFPYQWEKINI